MPTPSDIRAQILLQCKADGRSEIDAARQGLEQAKAAVGALEVALAAGTRSAAEFREEFPRLSREAQQWGQVVAEYERAEARRMTAVEKSAEAVEKASTRINAALAREAAAAQRAADIEIAEMAKVDARHNQMIDQWEADEARMSAATARAAKSSQDLGRATLIAGQGLQDFAQGGFGGVINQVDQLAIALGAGPGVAGVLTAVGVAAYVAGPYVKEFLQSLSGESFAVPRATEGLEAFQEQIKTVSKELDELKEKARLSYDEVQRFYELEFQKREAEAKGEAAKAAEGFAKDMTSEQREYAKAAKEVGEKFGGGDNLRKAIREYVERELGNVVEPASVEIRPDGTRVERPAVVRYRDLDSGTYTATADEVANQFMQRLARGDQSIYKFLANRALPGAAGGNFFNAFDPETIKVIDKANKEEAEEIERGARAGAEAARGAERQAREAEAARNQAIGRHAAAIGGDKALGGLIGTEGRKLVAQGTTDPTQLVAALTPQIEAAIAKSQLVPEELIGFVTQQVLSRAVEKMLAEVIAGAGPDLDIQKATAEALKAGEAKAAAQAAGKAAAAAKKGAKAGADQRQRAVAREIMIRSGGEVPEALAMEGAAHYQKLVGRGADPALAAEATMAQLAQLLQRQQAQMEQAVGIMNGMGGMIQQANQGLGGIGMQQQMMQAQMRNMRVQQPWPMSTVPF